MNPRLLYLLFFVSGFSGLLFEVVWTRLLLRVFGVGTTAGACVLAAFMAGLGIGAALAAQLPRRVNPLAAYGLLELVVAVCGVGIPALLSGTACRWWWAQFGSANQEPLSGLTNLITAMAILLLPCIAMGASYPLMLRALPTKSSSTAIILYATNVAGAAAGAMICGFLLLPAFGLATTSALGGTLELLVGLAALLMAGRMQVAADPEPNKAVAPPLTLAWSVALVSAIGILLQLCWYRLYFLLLGNSVYSNATVVSTVLLAIAASALLARNRFFAGENARTRLPLIVLMAALTTAAGMFVIPYVPWIWLKAVTGAHLDPPLVRWIISVLVVFVPSLFIGAVLPLSIKAGAGPDGRTSPGCAADLYAANCFGALMGAAVGGLILLPQLADSSATALRDSLLIAVVLLAIVSFALAINCWKGVKLAASALAVAAAIAIAFCSIWDPIVMSLGISFFSRNDLAQIDAAAILPRRDRSAVFYREGLNSTVSITHGENVVSLRTDGKVEASLAKNRALLTRQTDEATHVLLGALPMLLCENKVKEVLLIGMGSGTTCATILRFAELESIAVAELEKAVSDAAGKLAAFNGAQNDLSFLNTQTARSMTISRSAEEGYDPSGTPTERFARIGKLLPLDARFLLSTSSRKYNAIICQPGDPWVTGSSDLFTHEFWALAKDRLNEGGVCCQWMQAYGLPKQQFVQFLYTFQSVFPHTYVCHAPGAGELILLGFNKAPQLRFNLVNRRLGKDPYRRCLLARSGIISATDALALVKLDGKALAKKLQAHSPSLLSDDRPVLEFAAAQGLAAPDSTLKENLGWLFDTSAADTQTVDGMLAAPLQERMRADLGRSYARASLSGGLATPFNQQRALALVKVATDALKVPRTLWDQRLVLNACAPASQQSPLAEAPEIQAIKSLPAKHAEDQMARVDMALALQDFDLARQYLEHDERPPQQVARRLCWLNLAENRPQQALSETARFAHFHPLELLGAATALAELGKDEEAEGFMQTVLECDPWQAHNQIFMTALLCRQGKTAQASLHAKSALSLEPQNPAPALLVLAASLQTDFDQRLLDLHTAFPENATLARLAKSQVPLTEFRSRDFALLLNKARSDAFDKIYGYKMFGIP